MPPNEEWRTIRRLPDYEVSNLGRVRRKTADPKHRRTTYPGKIKARTKNIDGYWQITVWNGKNYYSVKVAKLVADAFLGLRPPKMTINHIDGDKTNDAISNLEYVSLKQNIRHAWKLGLTNRRRNPNGTFAS